MIKETGFRCVLMVGMPNSPLKKTEKNRWNLFNLLLTFCFLSGGGGAALRSALVH